MLALLLPKDMADNFPRFLLLCFSSIRSCSFNVTTAIVKVFRSPGSRGPPYDLVPVPYNYRARCDKKHINSEIYLFRVAFDNSML